MATFLPPPFPGGYPSPSPCAFSSYPAPELGFFPSPAYGSPSLPSAATYQQPLPFTPPSFPYAATYPYPPPATAYTPASGFSPNWPIWPPPAPDPTPPTPTSMPSCCWSSPMTTPVPPHHPATARQMLSIAAPSSSSFAYSPPPPTIGAPNNSATRINPIPNAAPTSPNPQYPLPQYHAAARSGFSTSPLFEHPDANSPVLTEMESTSAVSSTGLFPGSASLASLQSELSKLMDMASSLNNSMAKACSMMASPVSRTTTTPTPSVDFAPLPRTGSKTMAASAPSIFCPEASSSASSISSPFGASATADAAPQIFDEMPQQYGLHNLDQHSLFRADGTEHSYFTLPTDYPLEQANPPVSHSAAEIVPTSVQDGSDVFKEMPVYDVYEDVTACRSSLHSTVDIMEVDTEEVEVTVDSGKQIISHERPTDGIFSFTNEKKSDTRLLPVCFNNDSDNALSEEATDLNFSYVPVIHGDKSIKLTNEKSTHTASTLCVHEEIVQPRDPQTNVLVIHERREV